MSVTINTPASGATLTGTTSVTATFVGSRFDVATVTLNGTQLASDSTQPLAFAVDTRRVSDGAYTLTVAVRAGSPKRWQKASIPVMVRNAVAAPPASIPSGLAATAGDRQVTLHWNKNPTIEAIDHYQVYKNDQTLDLNVAGTSYVATGLSNGTAYGFRVSAHNAQGYGDWSAPVSATPIGAAPSNVATSAHSPVVTV